MKNIIKILFTLIFAILSVNIYARELAGDDQPILPWSFVLNSEKPEIPMARALFDSTHSFNALHYTVSLTFPFTNNDFAGVVKLDAISMQAHLSQITLHMMHLIADSVYSQPGSYLNYVRTDSAMVISLPQSYQPGDTFSVFVKYHDSAQQRGMYFYPRNYYTMAEPYDARWWFPCFDEPWDKATADIWIALANSGPGFPIRDVASNGTLLEVTNSGDYTTYHFQENIPMCTYLFMTAFGDFAHWTVQVPDGQGDSIPCVYDVFPEDSIHAVYDFANVPQMMEAFNYYFGPYPFEKYGMVAVEPFVYGGMEHQTMTTINRSWINGTRANEFGIAHELAHQWWGDMVTMSDFRHIWLNEGFATYSEALFSEYFYGDSTYPQRIQRFEDIYFYYDQYVGRFPLFDPVAYFNAAEYYKGALILHMLRGMVGEDNFFTGLRNYGVQYRYGNASTEDFRDEMEAASGQNLDYFFHEWIYEQGYPEYQYAWNYSDTNSSHIIHVNILQVQQNAPVFSMPIQLLIQTSLGDTLVTVFNSQYFESFAFDISGVPTGVVFDPNHWVTKKVQLVNSVDENGYLPKGYSLKQNYPNPFNNNTVISFSLPQAENVKLTIYEINGRRVKVLQDGQLNAGNHDFFWDGKTEDGFPSAAGIYLYRLIAGGQNLVKKMTYLK
jgi:aminopeptidase N